MINYYTILKTNIENLPNNNQCMILNQYNQHFHVPK